jgi:hypothetical protein
MNDSLMINKHRRRPILAYFRENKDYGDDVELLLTSLLQTLSTLPTTEPDRFHWEELLYSKEVLEKALKKKSLVSDFENIDPMDLGFTDWQDLN